LPPVAHRRASPTAPLTFGTDNRCALLLALLCAPFWLLLVTAVLLGAQLSAGEVAAALARAGLSELARSDEVVALRCPHPPTAARMASQIRLVRAEKDSTGGVLTTIVTGMPLGLGEPCFDKAEALLAHAMLSLPATKGFEIGSGFAGSRLRGSPPAPAPRR
jgi:chorismate synthase